jgi:hypothetical protein
MTLRRRTKKRHGDLKATGIRSRARSDRLPRDQGGSVFPTAENSRGNPAEISARLRAMEDAHGQRSSTVPRHLQTYNSSPFSPTYH